VRYRAAHRSAAARPGLTQVLGSAIMALEIIKTGTYRTGLLSRADADIISLDYDWWYSLAETDNQLEPDDAPIPLNAQGVIYYGRLKQALQPNEPTWPDTFGHASIEDAVQAIELKIGKEVRWS
jgi:hypothetical protein